MPSAISSSVTSTVLDTAPRQISSASSPANGGASAVGDRVRLDAARCGPPARPAREAPARAPARRAIDARAAVERGDDAARPGRRRRRRRRRVATPGTSSRISSASVPWPAITAAGRCADGRRRGPSPRRSSSSRVEGGGRVGRRPGRRSRRSRASPRPSARSRPATSRRGSRRPASRAAHATACAWFPADHVTTPRAPLLVA